MGILGKNRSYARFNLVTTLLEEAGIAVIMLVLMPHLGIDVPVWLIILLMALWGVYSYITFRLSEKVIDRAPLVGPEALIGARGKTTTSLSPEGYVRVDTELWRAHSVSGDIAEKTGVTVKYVRRLTLFVASGEIEVSGDNDHVKLGS